MVRIITFAASPLVIVLLGVKLLVGGVCCLRFVGANQPVPSVVTPITGTGVQETIPKSFAAET